MKKILITTTTFPLNSQDIQPRFIYYLAKHLQQKYQVTVLAPRGKSSLLEENFEGVYVKRYPYFLSRLENLIYGSGILENLKFNFFNYLLIPFFLLAQMLATLRQVKKDKTDIINAHWIIPQGIIAILCKKLFRLPVKVIVTSHGGDLYGLNSRLLNRLKRWVLEEADSVIVVSSTMKKYCYDTLGVNTNKSIFVRSMGVDLTNTFINHSTVEERSGLVFVGRLAEKKGLPVLFKALSILKSKNLEFNLNIIGSGGLQKFLEAQVESLNITSQVQFLGAKANQYLPSILNKHLVFVMPSVISQSGDQEGLGLVAVEAMGCGCVVIASDLEAVKDVVQDNINGLMFTAGDAVALADKIQIVFSDTGLMSRLALAGNVSAKEKFDWPSVISDYQEIIESTSLS
ncbi:glycosyltransferase family 4 protein [Aliikangiella sp. IMCC44359]|uniref:glycosyltransferase family 4 protein n=1 Tax=Aliikangiella sp. IMCC44359 TaxID=3459125 RepID=UPI00403AE49D